jgi:hypothetical protein
MSSPKSVTSDHSVITVTDPDTVYIPIKIISPSSAYKATMQILLKHTADINHIMMKIIAKKYNIALEDMIQSVTEDPEYKKMLTAPTINTLSYVSQQDVNSASSPKLLPLLPEPQKKMTVIRRLKPIK